MDQSKAITNHPVIVKLLNWKDQKRKKRLLENSVRGTGIETQIKAVVLSDETAGDEELNQYRSPLEETAKETFLERRKKLWKHLTSNCSEVGQRQIGYVRICLGEQLTTKSMCARITSHGKKGPVM